MLRSPISRAVILAAAPLLAIAPFFRWGTPSGHDFEFHLYSWMEVLSQWKTGIAFPHWAALAHWGYGEPRFLFYPPASWALGAALGSILPWKLVPGAYCWLALVLAAAAMYRLARRWLAPSDALFAAIFYALNPYHLLIVYWRSAYAELLAAALIPLLLLCISRLQEPGPHPTLCLSLILAAGWLTNIPAAVMIQYSTVGLALLLVALEHARQRKEREQEKDNARDHTLRLRRPLLRTALATLLGAGLASFYLLPAISEQGWINLQQVLSPGVRPQDNFLFTRLNDPDHNHFNLLLSTIALAEILVLAVAIWLAHKGWRESSNFDSAASDNITSAARALRRWLLLSVWGVASVLVMTSLSNILWQHLLELRYVQLPFRWLLCMNAALALLLTMAIKRWPARLLVYAILLATLIIAAYHTQPPWWVEPGDFSEMSDAIEDGTGYEGVDEYVPAGADASDLNKNLSPVSDEAGLAVPGSILSWSPAEKHFSLHSTAAQDLTLRLFAYPAWHAEVNGRPVAINKTDDTGLIVVQVPAGDSDVHIYFRQTTDRAVGKIISLVSLALLTAFWIKPRTPRAQPDRILLATSNPGKLRDFAGAAAPLGIAIANIPNFSSLPQVLEDGATFEENARKKAESYSLSVPGAVILADDSGLEIDALGGAPGVHSARYASDSPHAAECNADDEANNARVLRELKETPQDKRTARFVCVLAAARDGKTLQTFRGTAEGFILDSPQGENGFGYDPLFYFPQIGKTFAQLSAEEKARYSHRGAAFRAFLEWHRQALEKTL